jgi:hypothetical protein
VSEERATGEAAAERAREAGDAAPEPDGVRYGRRRRAPRYGSFVLTGAAVGVLLGLALSVTRPATGQFSQNSVIGYVAATLGLIGALLGAGIAVLLDRRR